MGKIEMIPCMEYTENNMTERDCKLALAKLKLKMRQKEQKE